MSRIRSELFRFAARQELTDFNSLWTGTGAFVLATWTTWLYRKSTEVVYFGTCLPVSAIRRIGVEMLLVENELPEWQP
jgi:hypothetical protein